MKRLLWAWVAYSIMALMLLTVGIIVIFLYTSPEQSSRILCEYKNDPEACRIAKVYEERDTNGR